jgi:hypothetical protein
MSEPDRPIHVEDMHATVEEVAHEHGALPPRPPPSTPPRVKRPKRSERMVRLADWFNLAWAIGDELRDGVRLARSDLQKAVGRARRIFDQRARRA